MMSLDEIVATAIEFQSFIPEQELKRGVHLNYFDEHGQYVLRYPDGHIEAATLSDDPESLQLCPRCYISVAPMVLAKVRWHGPSVSGLRKCIFPDT